MNRTTQKGLDAFFDYAKARHHCYLMKFADPGWRTPDPVLAEYSFCNVFRELDKTTMWFAENVRSPMSKARDPRLLLATVVFRMFNRIETGEAMFKDDNLLGEHSAFHDFARTGKTSYLKKAIVSRIGGRGPYVTGSYIIAGPGGMNKLDGVLEILQRFYSTQHELDHLKSGWKSAAERMATKKFSLQQAHAWLSQFDYLGNFHSYEMVTDLRHTFLLGKAVDIHTWANPGPGCRRGMNRVMGRDKSERAWDSVEDLLREMDVVLQEADAQWPDFAHKMRTAHPKLKTPLVWEMRDVEHTLCEFDKYRRTIEGDGRPRGKYRHGRA